MADEFKRCGNQELGPGGVLCPCCGPKPGFERKTLRRRSRARMKENLRRELKSEEILTVATDWVECGEDGCDECFQFEDKVKKY